MRRISSQVKASEAEMADLDLESDEEEEAELHFCVVCEKKFKSDKQLKNHEK